MFGGIFNNIVYRYLESGFIRDEMVSRGRDHNGVRIPSQDRECGISDAGGRVAAVRLKEQVGVRKFRELLFHKLSEPVQGHYENIL